MVIKVEKSPRLPPPPPPPEWRDNDSARSTKQTNDTEFNKYLSSRNIHLTKTQAVIATVLMKQAGKDVSVRAFFAGKATGKTFLFKVLEDYFTQNPESC